MSSRYSGSSTEVDVFSAESFAQSSCEKGSFYRVHGSAAFDAYGSEDIYALMFFKWGRTEFFN